jgi:hypothetical protein
MVCATLLRKLNCWQIVILLSILPCDTYHKDIHSLVDSIQSSVVTKAAD